MGFDIARQSLLSTIISFVLMGGLFLVRGEVGGYEPSFGATTPFQAALAEFMSSRGFIRSVTLFLLVFINSFYIARVVSRNLIFVERTYMPSLIYLTISLGYLSSAGSIAPLIAAFFIILAAEQMIASYNKDGRNSFFLNASFALGIAAIVYPPAVVMVLWLFVGLVRFGRSLREWIMSIALFVMPFFALSYIGWGNGDDFGEVWRNMLAVIMDNRGGNPSTHLGAWGYIFAGITLAVTVLSLLSFQGKKKEMRKRSYVAYSLFVWLLLSSASLFVLPCRSAQMLPILAIPLAVVMLTWFNRNHGLAPKIVYAGMVAAILVYNLIPVVNNLML